MMRALGPLLLSLLLLLQAGGCQEVKVVVAVGETVQLQPKTWPSSWVAINWIMKFSSQTHWILRHDQNSTSANPLLTFADRVSFYPGNLSLQINSVTEKESGLYSMDLTLKNGSSVTKYFRLFVLDRVRQPKIKASTSQECGRCYLTLSCLVPKAAWVTYSWSRGISSHPAPEDHLLQEHQADLHLEITKSGNNTFYHCNVSNAISWGTATIDVEPLCNYTALHISQHCCEHSAPCMATAQLQRSRNVRQEACGHCAGSVCGVEDASQSCFCKLPLYQVLLPAACSHFRCLP
ncbi:natural killer cell receptor 2B4-like isoform X2 [Alligator mississippiensis]|uniref:natural killer cell receptor 2B4-like isoform X2 n=1 Tax=Alligator mississippiensis TaxID=8496 RepID=UPI0028780A65|nr:natural killer cell receptor 2B4-like isoform X2 [Alligator mississippiensis]